MEVTKFWLLKLGYLLLAVKVASIATNATKLKSSNTQFQVQFELSLAQLSPGLSIIFVMCKNKKWHQNQPSGSRQADTLTKKVNKYMVLKLIPLLQVYSLINDPFLPSLDHTELSDLST